MTSNAQAIDKKNQTSISPESLRVELRRPFPQPSLRGIFILLVVVFVLAVSWNASRPTAINRINGIGDVVSHMADLVRRMFPVQFEWARNTERTINILGNEITIGWPLIVTAVIETIEMAIIGTLGAVVLSMPISLLAAKNTSPHPLIYQITRLTLNFMRSIPELIWGLLFVVGVGLGPFAGVLALAFGSIGSMSRIYAEAIEQIDPQQVLAVRATGATSIQTFLYSVIPQALPLLISYSIIYFESNVRHATILGLVGAGGIGLKLWEYTGLGNYPRLMGTVIVLVVAVTIIDRFSNQIRQRFI
ncbi:MAG: phosphonate ABC transporter, permease protein PhnE [Anaerolineae bacterium]|nr:phosphonate ABC transporter, permease protein PhnE [Anaerolineae bacterium]